MDIEHTLEDEEEVVLMNTLQDDDMSLVPEHIITRNVVKDASNSAEESNIPTQKEMIVEPELPSSSAYEEAMIVFKEAPWKELATSKAVWAMVSLFALLGRVTIHVSSFHLTFHFDSISLSHFEQLTNLNNISFFLGFQPTHQNSGHRPCSK